MMLVSSVALRAQTTITWSNSGASAWRSTSGWTGNVVPGGTDTAQVGATGVAGNRLAINFATSPVVNDVQIGAFELTSAYVKADLAIVNSGDRINPSTLTFNGATVNGTANVILRNASSLNLTIQHDGTHGSSPQPLGVVLGNSTANVVLIDGSGNITISSNISGSSKQLTLDRSVGSSGTGSLTLSGSNSFTGGVKVNAGTLNINSASALGTGTLEIVGGTLDNTSGSTISNSNNNAQTWSGNFTFTGTNDLNLGTGAVTLNGGNRTVTVSGGKLTVGGAIGDNADGYGLTKAGAGTLALSGNNTYSGGTTISAGTLTAGHDNALGTGSVIVNTGGTLAIGDNVTIGNEIQLDGGALQGLGNNSKFSGTLSGSGTLTGPLTLTESAVYQWHLNSASTSGANALSIATGTLTIADGAKIALSFGNGEGVSPVAGGFWDVTQPWTVISKGESGSIIASSVAVGDDNKSAWNDPGNFQVALESGSLVLIWTPHVAAIPEPSTYAVWLGAAALVGAGWYRRRQRAAKA